MHARWNSPLPSIRNKFFLPTLSNPTTDPQPLFDARSKSRYTECSLCILNLDPDVIGAFKSWAFAEACPILSRISSTLCWTWWRFRELKVLNSSGRRSWPILRMQCVPGKVSLTLNWKFILYYLQNNWIFINNCVGLINDEVWASMLLWINCLHDPNETPGQTKSSAKYRDLLWQNSLFA